MPQQSQPPQPLQPLITHRSEGRLITPDGAGVQLYEQAWLPSNIRAAVVLVHGYAEHSTRYKHVAGFLSERGYAVQTYDQRGHGKTDRGARIEKWADFWDDLDLVIAHTRARIGPDKPIFLYGHSMGGTVIVSYAITRQSLIDVAGLVVSSALLKVPSTVSPFIVKLGALISKIAPTLGTIPLVSAGISSDPAVVAAYDADPLVYHGKLPARIGAEMNRAVALIQSGMASITQPILIWHGTADVVTDPAGSQMLYERVQSADKTLKLYEGGFHEMHNEPNQAEVLADLAAWLDGHSR
jgi:alpha-beta hydrolase superfamily lysophospholipase